MKKVGKKTLEDMSDKEAIEYKYVREIVVETLEEGKREEEMNDDEEVIEANDDEEFVRTKAVPIFQEIVKRNIDGFSDGEYWYEIAWYRQEEEE